jgi:hypothetical protein
MYIHTYLEFIIRLIACKINEINRTRPWHEVKSETTKYYCVFVLFTMLLFVLEYWLVMCLCFLIYLWNWFYMCLCSWEFSIELISTFNSKRRDCYFFFHHQLNLVWGSVLQGRRVVYAWGSPCYPKKKKII